MSGIECRGAEDLKEILLPEIGFEQMRFLAFKTADGFLLDLTHTFASEVKLGTDLLESHLLTADSEEHLENLPLSIVELLESTIHLLGQRFLSQGGISHRRIIVGEHVEQRIVLALHKGSIDRNMTARDL